MHAEAPPEHVDRMIREETRIVERWDLLERTVGLESIQRDSTRKRAWHRITMIFMWGHAALAAVVMLVAAAQEFTPWQWLDRDIVSRGLRLLWAVALSGSLWAWAPRRDKDREAN